MLGAFLMATDVVSLQLQYCGLACGTAALFLERQIEVSGGRGGRFQWLCMCSPVFVSLTGFGSRFDTIDPLVSNVLMSANMRLSLIIFADVGVVHFNVKHMFQFAVIPSCLYHHHRTHPPHPPSFYPFANQSQLEVFECGGGTQLAKVVYILRVWRTKRFNKILKGVIKLKV